MVVRKISQWLFLALFVYILWSTTYPLQGFIPPAAIFTADPLIMGLTALAGRVILAGLVISLVMLLLTLVLGRFFCGWVCPLGTMIDAAGTLNKRGSKPSPRASRIKFFFLAFIAAAALAQVQAAWLLDPLVIAGRFVSLNLIPAVTSVLDKLFEFLISTFRLYGGVYDLYRDLRSSVLGIEPRYFSHSLAILALFLAILAYAGLVRRGWCRHFCPLGALYALAARFALLRKETAACRKCLRCVNACPMGAISDDMSCRKGECIGCLSCVSACPEGKTRFVFTPARKRETRAPAGGMTRRQFFSFMAGSIAAGFALPSLPLTGGKKPRKVLRPPGALAGDEFLNRCVRCGNCMKVCITNGLQPMMLQGGAQALWTPQLVPEIGYCEYRCTLCGSVCPTGAIPRLTVEEKMRTRIGLARIDRAVCLPWKKGKECFVCEEHCPVAEKAIKLKEYTVDGKTIRRPYIDLKLCIGCGICQTKCPTKPRKGVVVYPVKVTHGKAGTT